MRKHHNRLYFGKYTNKLVFCMPWACYLYPTTDQHLRSVLDHKEDDFKGEKAIRNNRWVWFFKHSSRLKKLASFIINNRNNMKFRIQHVDCLIYCNRDMAKDLVTVFWDEWQDAFAVSEEKIYLLDGDSVLCKRLPHGKFQYQVHLKRNIHKILKQSQRENLNRYLSQNPNTCHIANKSLQDYLDGTISYGWEGYFYVSDEKMLSPLYMIAPEIIQKVLRFVKVEK